MSDQPNFSLDPFAASALYSAAGLLSTAVGQLLFAAQGLNPTDGSGTLRRVN